MAEQTKTTDADKRIAADLTIATMNHRKELFGITRTAEDLAEKVTALYQQVLEKVKAS